MLGAGKLCEVVCMLHSRGCRLRLADGQQGRPALLICQVCLHQVWISYCSLQQDSCESHHVAGRHIWTLHHDMP